MKILFDTDIGSDIDDALALLLLLRIPDVDLIGVTTVYGCTDIRAKVAKKILDAAGRSAPVVAGCGVPLGSPTPVWHAGTEGDGVLSEEERVAPLETLGIAQGASNFVIDAVERHRDDLTILSLGALTNVAAALRCQPSLASRIGHLFFMGGGITFRQPPPRQLEPSCEYTADPSHNVRCDVKAAREVFGSGVPMTILTNDVTTSVWWDGPPVQQLMSSTAPPEAALVGVLLKVWLTYRTAIFGRMITGTCPHDPLTVAEALGSRFVTYCQGTMKVHADATTSFAPNEHGPHRAGVRMDVDGFLDWFSRMMTR
jgi:purine nucleosidase